MFKIIILIALSIMFSNSAFAKTCVDDPRMFTIKSVLEQAASGANYKPMKLTPTTFLMLTPPTREALGDNIVVYNEECIPQQIFKGQLPRKIEMPYEDLSYALHMSLIQNDTKTANVIFNSFVSTPKEPSEIVMMLSPLGWHGKAIDNLYKQGMVEKRGMENLGSTSDNKLCNSTISRLSHLELFSALGGKATKQDLVMFDLDSHQIYLYARNFSAETRNDVATDITNEVLCVPYNIKRVLSNLKTAMFDLQEVSSPNGNERTFKKYDQVKRANQTTSSSGN